MRASHQHISRGSRGSRPSRAIPSGPAALRSAIALELERLRLELIAVASGNWPGLASQRSALTRLVKFVAMICQRMANRERPLNDPAIGVLLDDVSRRIQSQHPAVTEASEPYRLRLDRLWRALWTARVPGPTI